MTKSSRSPDLMEAIQEAQQNPSQASMDKVHEKMLMDFIKKAEGLKGMILVAVRNISDDKQNIEVYADTSPQVLLSTAASLASCAGRIANECGEDEKAELCHDLAKCLEALSGGEQEKGEIDEDYGTLVQTNSKLN